MEARALQHVQKVGIPPGIELVSPLELDSLSAKRRPSVRWTMVAPTWLLMSSPMMGRPAVLNRSAHSVSEAKKTGTQLTIATPASRQALGVVANCLLRPDRQVAYEHLGLRCPQRRDHVHGGFIGRAERLVLAVLRHVLGDPVVHRSHLNGHPLDGKTD